jgi:hypothetical protein
MNASTAATVLVGIVGVLQGYFLLSAVFFGISLFRPFVTRRKNIESAWVIYLCITLGTSLGVTVVMLVPPIIIIEVLGIKFYNRNVWSISIIIGIVLSWLHTEAKASKRRRVES